MAVLATARAKNSQNAEQYRAYHGKTVHIPIGNPVRILELEETCDLLYGEFKFGDYWYLGVGCIFDIDIEDQRKHAIRTATVAQNKEALLVLLATEIDIVKNSMDGCDFCIYASGSKGIHVYVKNPKGFLVASDPKQFTPQAIKNYLTLHLMPEFVAILDTSFYVHNKGIRPYSCQHPVTGVVPFPLFTTENWRFDFLEWVNEVLQSTDFVPESIEIELIDMPAVSVSCSSNIPTPANRLIIKEISASLNGRTLEEWIKFQCGHNLRCSSGNRKKRYLYFSASDSIASWCPIANEMHPSNCCSWVRYENNVSVASCFDFACLDKIFVLRPSIEKPVTYPPLVNEEKITVLPETSSVYLPCDVLTEALYQHKRIVITAPMGSGKTEFVSKFIEDLPAYARVLIIGTRRQQTRAWLNFFSRHGFVLYDDQEGNLHETNRLLICLNSLLRVLDLPNEHGICKAKPFDLLVLDEADSLATWLGGPLLENNAAIFQCLSLLIKISTYTVCMEGLPTGCLQTMLNGLGFPEQFRWFVFNSFRFRELVMCNSTDYFTKCFTGALASGKNIFFVSNSKTAIFRFKDLAISQGISEANIMAIHGSMSEEDRRIGGNPDDWVRYKLVLANNGLGPGASFNPATFANHFALVFFVVKVSQGVRPEDIAQLINRVRHPAENKIIGIVLKKTTNDIQKQTSTEKLFKDRTYTIGEYSDSVLRLLAPKRELGKRRFCEKRISQETARLAGLGKTLAPAKRRRLEYVPSIVPLAGLDDNDELATIPRVCSFGLRFGSLELEKLCCYVINQGLYWSSDSEMFLERLIEILHLFGVGYTTIGERTKLDDEGNDLVAMQHYNYFKKLAKLAESDDSKQLDNDYFLLRIKTHISQAEYTKTRERLYSAQLAGMDTSLFRFYRIVKYYDSTNASIEKAIERDVLKQFEDVPNPPAAHQFNEMRPQSFPRGAALNNSATCGEMFNAFHGLLFILGKRMDPASKKILPCEAYSTLTYINGTDEYKQQLWDYTRLLAKLVTRNNPGFGYNAKLGVSQFLNTETPYPPPNDHKYLFQILYALFKWIGFPMVVKKKRVTHNKIRISCHEIEFDDDYIQMCKAIVGLNANGEKVDLLDALHQYYAVTSTRIDQ